MPQLAQWLDGKKTYIGMILLGILGLLWSQGLVTDRTAEALGALLTSLTGIAFRAAIAKATPNQTNKATDDASRN